MVDKIERYYNLKQQEKELKQEIEKLNKEIKTWMNREIKKNALIEGDYYIRVTEIDFRKFTDDIIPFLKLNGFEDLVEVKEVFDYDELKRLIRKGKIDKNSLVRFRSDEGKVSQNLYVDLVKNV